MRERFTDILFRYRYVLFAVWLLHAFLIHYFVLGYTSWDGLSYRVGPTIELLKHGALNKDKFNDWVLRGYIPFVELAHLPFLYLFKLRGLIIGFPLVVFPLCVWSVFLMGRELTGDRRGGLFCAFAYAAIPMMNMQPFAGYIDFAVAGILAFWIYAVARLRSNERRSRTYARLVIATVLTTLARQQGLYIAIALFPILAYAMFCTRERFRVRVADRRGLFTAAGWIAVGSVPAIVLQIYKLIVYGSPIAPLELKFFGVQICPGWPMVAVLHDAGLTGDDPAAMATGFFEGFVWRMHWPLSAFYGSRFMAAGLITLLALVLVPVFAKRSTRLERFAIVGFVLVSLLSRDYAVPRWAYTIMLSIVLIVGRSMAALVTAESRRGQVMFWIGCAVLIAHLFRPEFDLLQYREREVISPRMNIADSKYFIAGDEEVRVYPDKHFKIAIIESVPFYVALYGRKLGNRVLGTIPGAEIDPGCKRLASYPKGTIFVDDQHFSKNCNRECEIPWPFYCGGWRITPAP